MKEYKIMFLITVFLILGIVGGQMNIMAIASNDGKMPVRCDNCEVGKGYSTFTNDSEIVNPLLSDRFVFFDSIAFSLGDFIMYFAGLCVLIMIVIYWRSKDEE